MRAHLLLAGVWLLAAGGCASVPAGSDGGEAQTTASSSILQCVPYARLHSAVKIYGDAWQWWDKADGHYARAARPQSGSVMVLTGYAGPARGHLAVVRSVASSRMIRVDHANWFNDGAIYVDNPVADVSSGNDWSVVRVWNMRTGAWGGRLYPVQGFIGPGPAGGITDLVAFADSNN
jgi:surface antigen